MAVNINPAIHAHLTGMSDAEIAQAADRWKSLELAAGRLMDTMGLDLFAPSLMMDVVRSLDEPKEGYLGIDAAGASKLTELADLVRAKSLEDAIEQSNQT